MHSYEIVTASGQVAYVIQAANLDDAERQARKLCAKSGVAVTVREVG